MDTATEFDELAGVRVGVTTAKQLRELLGDADACVPRAESGCFLLFRADAIEIGFVGDSNVDDELVDEVRLRKGSGAILKCGLHLGMERRAAVESIRQKFTVIDEYDDSIYFIPSGARPLVACAEFIQENAITSLELCVDAKS